jgi:hypothetical protein
LTEEEIAAMNFIFMKTILLKISIRLCFIFCFINPDYQGFTVPLKYSLLCCMLTLSGLVLFMLPVNTVMGYGLDSWGSIPNRQILLHSIKTSSKVHPTTYPMGTPQVSFPGGKVAAHLPTSTAEEWWNYASPPPYIFMALSSIS